MNAPHCARLIEGVGAISYRHVLGRTAIRNAAANRFAFGKNWRSFAAIADEETISEAQRC